MKRSYAVQLLEVEFLKGKWLNREEIMRITGFNADVTHLTRGLVERGIPVTRIRASIPCNTVWGLPEHVLDEHDEDPQAFRVKNLKALSVQKVANAKKKVRHIKEEHGPQLVTDVLAEAV
ncbi:hypothetical protein BS007_RS17110 [Vibrio parahaemolyticus]|nr:hypothetical protein [Vibrio parahaemolyticus]HCG9703129.1 hypothetical protein [Vibrio parahaemolyticus]